MILIYLVYFFLILRFTVTVFNFISNPKLTGSNREYNDLVSILIPARNDEGNILNLLQSVKEQDYTNFEVIVLDEGSDDNTLALSRTFCKTDNRFRAVPGKRPPAGWLSKNYACFQLADAAKGKYLMFLDANVIVADKLINNSIHRMKVNRLSLLSLFTNQTMLTWGERLVMPLIHYILLNLLPLRLVSLSRSPAFSVASSLFMLFDADKYVTNQWHEQVKGKGGDMGL